MKIVVSNVFGPVNRGDEELFATLSAALLDAQPDVELVAIARDPQLCAERFPGIRFEEQLGKWDTGSKTAPAIRVLVALGLVCASLAPALKRLLPRSQCDALDAIASADLVIACPGGYIEDSSFSGYLSILQPLCAVLRKRRLVMAPQSIGPMSNPIALRCLKFVLSRAEHVFVRDAASKALTDRLGVEAKLSADLALSRMNSSISAMVMHGQVPDASRVAEYVVVVPMRWAFPNSEQSRSESTTRFVSQMVELVEHLGKRLALPIVLMEQVGGDRAVIDRIVEASNDSLDIVRPESPDAARTLMHGAAGVVSCRLHGGIFGLQAARPVVFLEYLPKTTGVLDVLGLKPSVFMIDSFDPAVVAESLDSAAHRQSTEIDWLVEPVLKSWENGDDSFADWLAAAVA